MYRGIAHLSKKTAGRIGKENWENKLFLTFSSIVWFWIGGFAAALCCAATEFVLTKTISGTFFGSVLLIARSFCCICRILRWNPVSDAPQYFPEKDGASFRMHRI